MFVIHYDYGEWGLSAPYIAFNSLEDAKEHCEFLNRTSAWLTPDRVLWKPIFNDKLYLTDNNIGWVIYEVDLK